MSKMSDSQLLWLFAETRATEYFGELFLRYLPLVYGLCLNSFPDRDAAKKIVRQLLEKLPGQLVADVAFVGEFKDWLYERVSNYIYESIRQKNSDDTDVVLSYAAVELLDVLKSNHQDRADAIASNSKRMTKPQRECVRLFLCENKSFADIANETGYLNDDVRAHIVRGLESVVAKSHNKSTKKRKG